MDEKSLKNTVDIFRSLYDYGIANNNFENYNDNTFNLIMERIKPFLKHELSLEEISEIKKIIDAEFEIYIPDSPVLLGNYEHERDWYSSKKDQYSSFFWDRYRSYLRKDGWSPNVLHDFEVKSVDKMVDLLGDPRAEESFSRKGLIMGDVQSGKTSNYIGLISKAADAGYKVIILLTGIIESLRKQTQIRVEEGFIGYDVDSREWVGVGTIQSGMIPKSPTSRSNDFTGISGENTMAQFMSSAEPFIFITKKNPTTLKKIRESIQRINLKPPKKKIDTSILIIDDEADNASVNTNNAGYDPTKINAEIRLLIDLFTKSNYVGFTATPFANVFIDPESYSDKYNKDLFPNDFIFRLSSPSSYFGAEKMFLTKPYNTIQLIEDYNEHFPVKHKSDWNGSELFNSLHEAINAFLIVNAIRDLREKEVRNSHRSMLINVSRFIKVHDQISFLVSKKLEKTLTALRYSTKLSMNEYLKNSYIKELYETYNKQYATEYSWNELFEIIFESTKDIQVVKITSKDKKGMLDYEKNKEKGLRVIVIGGLTLSRGITLEGLTISYLYRNTQTFDVLMQMGRWFGYRTKPKNFEDLCRVWMLETTVDYFTEITRSIVELKSDFRKMIEQEKTPYEFGIRVRNESEEMGITSSNKMRSSKKYIYVEDLYGKVLETPFISSKRIDIEANYAKTEKFLRAIGAKLEDKRIIAKDVEASIVLDYLSEIDVHDANRIRYFEKDTILKFLKDEKYSRFDVAVINGKTEVSFFGELEYRLAERKYDFLDANTIRVNGVHYRLGAKEDTSVLLDNETVKKIRLQENVSAKSFMVEGRNPLLMIYGLKLKKSEDIYDIDEMVKINEYSDFLSTHNLVPIGIGIGIPANNNKSSNTKMIYYINDRTKWWNLMQEKDKEEND
jgi:hypothetical protein